MIVIAGTLSRLAELHNRIINNLLDVFALSLIMESNLHR